MKIISRWKSNCNT